MRDRTGKSFKQLKLRQLDAQLKSLQPLRALAVPRSGWIREIRRALGMTSTQLAARLGRTKQLAGALERAEAEGKVTLGSLRRAANAMGCDVVYAIVPRESLEKVVDQQAYAKAAAIMDRTSHSMWLERQATSDEETAAQTRDLADKLRAEWSSRLWDITTDES